jgi:hypothetical protein
MKIAFHFNADDPILTGDYGTPIVQRIFRLLVGRRGLRIDSSVLLGDLRLHELKISCSNILSSRYLSTLKMSRIQATCMLLDTRYLTYSTLARKSARTFLLHNIFVVYLKNVNFWQVKHLDNHLGKFKPYLGALEINDKDLLHRDLYEHQLIDFYHIKNRKLNILMGLDDDDIVSEATIAGFIRLGFDSVKIQYTLGNSEVSSCPRLTGRAVPHRRKR